MSHVIWNLLLFRFSMHRDFLSVFTRCNSNLTFLPWGKSHDFDIKCPPTYLVYLTINTNHWIKKLINYFKLKTTTEFSVSD